MAIDMIEILQRTGSKFLLYGVEVRGAGAEIFN